MHRLLTNLAIVSTILVSGCGILRVRKPADGDTTSAKADGPRRPSADAADADTELKVIAAADCSTRPAVKKSGYDPFVMEDVPCAVRNHQKLYVAVTCGMSTAGDKGTTLVPGMAAEAEALGTGVTGDDPPLRIDLKIKLTTGEEGVVNADCLSRAPIAVSFLPPKKKPANGEAALFGLMKTMFNEAYPVVLAESEAYKKNGYKPFDPPEQNRRMEGIAKFADFYTQMLHQLTYGGRELAQVLKNDETKWLADWPDELGVAYADGLKGKSKEKAIPAVDCLKMMDGFRTFMGDYQHIASDEQSVDKDVADVPESKRASVKQKTLGEIAVRRKEIDKKVKDWMDKAKASKNDVRL